MTSYDLLLAEQKRTNELLHELVQKISTSPLTSGMLTLQEACDFMGWTSVNKKTGQKSYETGRKKLSFLRDKGKLTRPESNPTKFYTDELIMVQAELRDKKKAKQINMKYYNRKAA